MRWVARTLKLSSSMSFPRTPTRMSCWRTIAETGYWTTCSLIVALQDNRHGVFRAHLFASVGQQVNLCFDPRLHPCWERRLVPKLLAKPLGLDPGASAAYAIRKRDAQSLAREVRVGCLDDDVRIAGGGFVVGIVRDRQGCASPELGGAGRSQPLRRKASSKCGPSPRTDGSRQRCRRWS